MTTTTTTTTARIDRRREVASSASAALLAVLAVLGGCSTANLSGIGGETTFKCKAPDGVQCQSVSGTYANARVGNLPSQQSPGGVGKDSGTPMGAVEASVGETGPGPGPLALTSMAPAKAASTSFASRSNAAAPLTA